MREKVNPVNARNASYGVYIPPFKRRQMELEKTDLASSNSADFFSEIDPVTSAYT